MSNLNKKSVIFIEDDPVLARILRAKFERENIELKIVSDGKAALELLNENPPDAVLLDLMLPYVSGLEVLKKMRENENWKNIPVIILSNLGAKQDIEAGLKLGANDYLVKAATPLEEVIKKLKILLSNG
jgi:DNA-binding response OmpR family regulator